MSWLEKLLPPKIKREGAPRKSNLPEGLWRKCPSCEAVLYATDLENNLQVCPKCGHHNRLNSRQRCALLVILLQRTELQSFVFFFKAGQLGSQVCQRVVLGQLGAGGGDLTGEGFALGRAGLLAFKHGL